LHATISWIVATTDSLASRKLVHHWAHYWGISYIEAAAEGEKGSFTAAPGEWETERETHEGYQHVPVWVGPCVMAAAGAVAHIVHDRGMHDDRVVRLGWNKADNSFEVYDSTLKLAEEAAYSAVPAGGDINEDVYEDVYEDDTDADDETGFELTIDDETGFELTINETTES
jgi:hypothetical protein